MRRVSTSWRIIEDVLRENAHSIFRALRKPVSEKQLQRLQSKFATKLPRDFVQSWKIHDGLRGSHLGQNRFFNYWAFLPVSAILDDWKLMTDLQAECGFGGCQFDVTPRIKNDMHWRPGWLPFMDADGNLVAIDLDPGPTGKIGQVFVWSYTGSFPTRLVADSFGEWLSEVAEKFSKRQFRLNEFGQFWFDANEKFA